LYIPDLDLFVSVGKYLLFCRTHYKFQTIYVCSPEQLMCRGTREGFGARGRRVEGRERGYRG
jgi:hypothetical protein